MYTDSTGTSAWSDFWKGVGIVFAGVLVIAGVAALTAATFGADMVVAINLGLALSETVITSNF